MAVEAEERKGADSEEKNVWKENISTENNDYYHDSNEESKNSQEDKII